MCGTSEKSTTSSQQTSQSFPDWTQSAGKGIFDTAAQGLAANPTMPSYTGQTVANFGSGFGDANSWASSFLSNPTGLSQQQTDGSNALSALMGSIDPNKSVSDYMNPYVDATLAPTIRNINTSLNNANATTSAGAAAAGALGDTGWGNAMALNQKNAGQQISDATANAYSGAFNNAQSARNTALSQLTGAATADASIGQQGIGNQSAVAQLLASLGSTQQAADQKGLDTAHSDWLTGLNYPIKQGIGLSSILSSIPKNMTGTQDGTSTTSQPDNSGMAIAGNLLGALLLA